MTALLRSAVVVFLGLTVVTGAIYPAVVTLVAQTLFPHQAKGSLVYAASDATGPQHVNARGWWGTSNGDAEPAAIGSALVGQHFSGDRYFWGRPSATGPTPYNAAASTGSNLGPTNPAQIDAVKQRVERLRQSSGDPSSPVPIDLVTASGSGLDPHITPAAAQYQVRRVAKARHLDEDRVRELVTGHTQGRTFGLLGEPRVNVLTLNIALDGVAP